MSQYCTKCGKLLPDGAVFCAYCGARRKNAADSVPAKKASGEFYHTDIMADAANRAYERNFELEWAYWDSPAYFTESFKNVKRYCEKEDKRLKDDPERPHYVVSRTGAIGQIYIDENMGEVLEWIYLTRREGTQELPVCADDPRL